MNFAPLISKINTLQIAAEKKELLDLSDQLRTFLNQVFRLGSEDEPVNELLGLYTTLNKEKHLKVLNDNKLRKILEEINVIILTLVRDTLQNQPSIQEFSQNKAKPKIIKKNKKNLVAFSLLAALGVVFAAVEGASILQMLISAFVALESVPALVLIPAQILFACLTAGAFYIFEVTSIGKKLGIKGFQLGAIFKYYDLESQLFREIFSLTGNALKVCGNQSDFDKLNEYHSNIYTSYNSFERKITEAKTAIQPSRAKKITKKALTIGAGAFCGIIAALGAQSILTTLIPVALGASLAGGPLGLIVMIGLMAVCAITTAAIFFLIEKKCDTVVDKVCGTPTKKIKKIIARDSKIKDQSRLNNHVIVQTKNDLEQKAQFAKLLKVTTEKATGDLDKPEKSVSKPKKQPATPTSDAAHLTKRKNPKNKKKDKNIDKDKKIATPEKEDSRIAIAVING